MVAHLLPKQRVAGSNPVSRSTRFALGMALANAIPFVFLGPHFLPAHATYCPPGRRSANTGHFVQLACCLFACDFCCPVNYKMDDSLGRM